MCSFANAGIALNSIIGWLFYSRNWRNVPADTIDDFQLPSLSNERFHNWLCENTQILFCIAFIVSQDMMV